MKQLPLTYKGEVFPAAVIVDDDIAAMLDNKLIRLGGWGYPVVNYDRRETKLTNLVLGYSTGPGLVIDHINGNKFDSRRENLRWVNKSENALNTRAHRDSKTGFRGVSPSSRGPGFRARMKIGDLQLAVDGIATKEDAARQINRWIKEHNVTAPYNNVDPLF